MRVRLRSGTADRKLFFATLVLWLAIMALYWPRALSFADEVAYVGQAKLLIAGRLQATRLDPGIWVPGPHGLVNKYPLLWSCLIAPLVACWPPVVFAAGVAAALSLALVTARVLSGWGRRPLWALIVLAHPTLIILARTAMADVFLSALGLWAWASLRRSHAPVITLLFALLSCTKPVGAVVAGCLLAGEALRVFWMRRRAQKAPLRALVYAALGTLFGLAVTLLMTFVATSGLRSGYQIAQPASQAFFSAEYVPHHFVVYATTLLLCPPLLLLGLTPLWRRREFGAVLVVSGLCALMSAYFFVDRGQGFLETLVLSQRLILPAVSFLLVGYADGLSASVERWPRLCTASTLALLACPLAVALGVSSRHQDWQRPMVRALAAAAPLADRAGHALSLTEESFKAGLLYAGSTSVFEAGTTRAKVVLCSTRSWSHRSRVLDTSCKFEGYRSAVSLDGFEVLVPTSSAATPQR